MKNKLQFQEIKRWLKTSLKNKVSINNKTIITYLMLGLVGVSNIAFSGWSYKNIRVNAEGSNNAPNAVRSLTVDFADGETKTDNGSIIFAEGHRINTKLKNSVVIGYAQGKKSQKLEIDVENGDSEHSIIAIGSAKVLSNPYLLGRTGSGGQAVSIGSEVVSTTQAVAIGNNTYALGASSIAIGNDDNESYYDNKISYYDYLNYLKDLYTVLNRDSNSENNTSDSTGTSNDVYNTTYKSQYSPNVAKGKGSIAIGSRALAFNDGSTSLGTLAFALGKGSTALGTQSRAEGEGSIAIGNKTRNFADQALAVGNDSQIRQIGGTAVGLRARSAGEGAIAIGTDVYANVSINNGIRNVKTKGINEIETILNNLQANTITVNGISGIVKNTNEKVVDGSKTAITSAELKEMNKNIKLAKNAIAIGTKSAAVGDNSIVLGRGSFAFGKNSFSLGSYSYAEAENGAAIGIGAKSISYENSDNRNNDNYMHNGKNAMAIGNGALATLENSISIGVNSKTDYSYNELLKPGWVPEGTRSIPSSGRTGVISVGSKGYERRIVNVAPGYRGTDAVNVDQLKSFENRLENKQYDSGFTMQYISVEKNKGKAKEISDKLKLNSEYIEYIDLREQLELIKARHKFKDEEIVAETKTEIETRIAELERNPLIKRTAGEMGTYTSDSLATGTSEQDKENNFKAFYNNLEAKKKEALKEETKKPLFGNKLLKDILANTNYNNDGATGKDAMAFGYRTEASGEAAIAIGAPSDPAGSTSNDVITKATGLRGIAIGAGAENTGKYSVALGSNSKVTVDEGIAIGDRAEATLEKSVAIGSSSTVTATSGPGYLTNQAKPEYGMVVSVGGRRIQKLKDGAADDDAVTVAQLKKLKEQTLTRDNAKITIAPDENGTQEFTIGSTINLKTNDVWGSGDGRFVGDNIETYKKNDGTILIGVKENPKFKTISLNNKENNATDLILSSDKNGNLSLGNKKIINVGEGSISSNSTDVVIGKQLKATEDKIETLKANALTKTEASTTYVTKTEAGNIKLKYAANKDAAKEVLLSSGLKFTNGTNTTAEVADNGVVKFNLNTDLTGITSITSGENKAKLTFGDNITVNSKKITGLVDAELSASSTDAVTGKQLNTTNTNVTNLTTKVGTIESNITTLTNKGIKFKGDTGSEITTKLGSTLNIKGDDSSITTNSSGAIIKISVKDGGISKEKLSNDLKTTINNSLSKSDADSTYAKKDASNIDETKYISKLNTGASIATPKEKLVKDSDVKNYLTTNYITKTEVESKVNASKTIVEASTGSPITVSSSTSGSANKYTIGIDSDKLKEIAGTKEKGNVTSTDINVTNGDGRIIGNTELKLSIKNGAITKDKLENDLKTKIEKIADDANGTYATKTELNSKANKDATNLSEAEITKWKEKLGVTNIDLSYKAGADTAAKKTTLSNGLHFKSDGGNLSVKSENNGVITYSISQTDSINKTEGTTATNKLTTEKAVKDYVASEIAGINTTVGNTTLTLSKDGTEETEKINLKTDKLTVKGTNGIDVSIADKAITVKIDDTTKGKIDGALSKTEASTTYITKTEAGNTYVTKTEVVNTKLKYAANTETAKEVSLSSGLKFTNGTNTTAEVADNGVVKFNLNTDLTGITSITSGDNKAKLTFGDNDITVNSKKITGLTDAELSASSTDAVTGKQLKSTEDKVTTLTTNVNNISSNITNLTSGGIKFKGNDNGEVTTALGSKLNLVGEGVNSSDTFNSASGNIKVEKGTSTDTLTFKLSKDLKNIKSIELKDGDKTSTLTINNEGDVTIGGNKVVTTNNIGAQTIGYKANGTGAKTTTLTSGFNFLNGTNTTATVDNDGVVKFNLNTDLTGITSITSGENKAKLTLGDDNISLNDKKLTGLTDATLSDSSTDAVTGKQLKTTNDNVETLTTNVNNISSNITNLTSGGIKFKGNDNTEITTALGSTLNLVGEGNVAGETASDNIKVEKGTSTDKLTFKLSKDLKNIKSIELKDGDKTSTLTINNEGDVTIGGNKVVTTNNIGSQSIGYKANGTGDKTTTLTTGFNFLNGTNTIAEISDNGGVKFNLNSTLTGITSITSGDNKAKLTLGDDNISLNDKKITGIMNGSLSATSKDAITGSQLYDVLSKIELIDKSGNIVKPKINDITSKDGNTTKSETIVGGINNIINTLNNGITFAGVEGSSKQYLGSTLTIKNGDITNNNINFKGENLITKYTNNAGDGTLTIGLKESPTFKEVTISDKATINGKEVATKDDLSNVNSAITLNLTKDGTTNHGSVNLKDQKLKVTGEDGLDVEISGQDIKVKLGSDFKKKVDKIINNPTDGKDGKNGTEANSEGSKGATGKDGLNGKDLSDKVNALRNGEAGTVIFTNENGDRLYKGNDGKYYLKDQLNDNGTPKTGFENSGIANPELRLVNADGTTTKATTLNNLANGLAGITHDTDKPITPEKAKEVITALLTQTTGLDKAVNVGDLQALAQAGLDFIGNNNTVSLHRELGRALQISGERNTDETFESASDNINVKVLEDATKNISKLEIQLAKALKNIESIQNGDTKITLDKDKSNVEIANGDKAKTTINEDGIKVIGKDGKDAVTLNGTDGTNGASVIVKGKDGADGVTIKGGNGTDAPTISFATKDNKGTGIITGLKDPDGNDKTAATTVNYVTNEIAKATTSLTDKGLKFVGNDGNEVTKKLGETLSIKGEGVSSSDTFNSASGNIKVSKVTDGLEIGLSKNLKNIETIELKGKDGVNGTIGIDKGELTLTKDSKTTKILTEANIGDQKIKYKANDGTSKEVKLSDGFNFTNGENTTAEIGDNGVVKVNVNSKLNNIESIAAKDSTKGIEITNGDKAKTTINEDGIKVIGKDGKDAVTLNGTDGTNGASVIVKGKDGADGVTIKGGNGTDAPTISFATKDNKGTGIITGLKDPDGNDKTAATTVNYVTNEIAKATTSLTDKGLKFVGNDGNEVTKKLGETLSIKGEGVSSSDTFNSASGNIKVSKVTDGLEIGLSKNLKNIETIELKGKDGVNGTIGIDKGELTLTKDSKTTKILTEANIGDQKIKYKANDGTSKEVKLSDGFNFTNGENTTAEIGDNGVVKVSVNSTLNKMKAINFENGKITGLATPDGKDVTSAANVAYVDKKVSNVEHLSNKALSGVANAIAMANLPQITANSEYNTSIGASYGTYNGENSLALGVSGVNNKANFLYRASASLNTKGNVAFGIGLGYQFGKKKDILENSKLIKLEEKFNILKQENESNKSKVSELEVIVKEISKENDKLRKEINEKDIQNEYRVIRLEEQNIEMKNYLEKLILENQKNKEILEKLLKNSESK